MAILRLRGSTALALFISPLAAPATVWGGTIVRGLFFGPAGPALPHPLAAALVMLLAFEVLGAAGAYAGTLLVVWPAAAWLRARGVLTWWAVTGVAAAAGAALFPVYLHLLDAHMQFDFFPGAGAVGAAATGALFWFIATRG